MCSAVVKAEGSNTEPYILPDQLCAVVVKSAANNPVIYIFHSLNKETIDSFLISPLLDKGWNSFGNYWGKTHTQTNQGRDQVILRARFYAVFDVEGF